MQRHKHAWGRSEGGLRLLAGLRAGSIEGWPLPGAPPAEKKPLRAAQGKVTKGPVAATAAKRRPRRRQQQPAELESSAAAAAAELEGSAAAAAGAGAAAAATPGDRTTG